MSDNDSPARVRSSDLFAPLQRDIDRLTWACGVPAIVVGVLLLGVPGAVRWLLQLGGATDLGLRALGAAWVAAGLWFAATSRRPRSPLVVTVSALLLWAIAAVLLIGPFLFGLDVGWFGWLLLFGLALVIGVAGGAWWIVRNRMSGRVLPRPGLTSPRSVDTPTEAAPGEPPGPGG